jgi:hypothetical protein
MTNPFETFATEYRIEMTVNPGPSRREGWDVGAHHYYIRLATNLGTVQLTYSMGSGLKGGPTLAAVLESVQLDCSSVYGRDFEEWCGDFGYDTDSRKALATYSECVAISAEMETMLGPVGFDAFMELRAE